MIRITAHANDPAFLVLRIDQAHNRVVGSFEPARRQDDMGVGIYVMEADKLPSLKNWARFQDIHILNEVRDKAEPTRALECANVVNTWVVAGKEVRDYCAAPYPAGRIPKFCGACGQAANPVIHGEASPDIGAKCSACGHAAHGGPKFCPACGAAMPERHLSAPAIRRTKGEPQPLGEVIADVSAQLHPSPSGPVLHPTEEEASL